MIAWLFSPFGRLIAAGITILTFLVAFAYDQRQTGAQSAIAKVERNNVVLNQKAGSAGRKSLDPAARGVLNPYYRD